MAIDLPTDLIQQVQITLRNTAGISSYDPRDPTLPSLPPVESTIAGIDPSPPYLRCSHCKGKLLRGLQSLICVYCGKGHKKDFKPDPIAFNSTLGYKWLLESLHFDGSIPELCCRNGQSAQEQKLDCSKQIFLQEVVELSSVGSEFNRSQNTPKENISLSELLDLQITWSDEPEEPENVVTKTLFEQSESTFNLSADEFDYFFPGSERNNSIIASEEHPAVSNQIPINESNTFASPKNLNLFQDVPPSESEIQSSIHASTDSFTGWEADFQSADDRNQHEDSKPVEPILSSAVDLSVHMDSVFGPTDDPDNGKLNSDSALPPIVSDWIQDDGINNVNSSVIPQQAPLFDSVVEAKNDDSSDNLGNLSSENVEDDWFQDAKWQNSTVTSESMNKDDDLFGEMINNNAASPPPMVNDWVQDDLLNNIKSSVSEAVEQFKFAVKANDGVPPDYQNNQASDSVDWFQDSKWSHNSANNMVNDDVDIFGVGTNNFIAPTPLANDWIQHDLLNNISSSDSWQAEQFDLPIEAKGGMSSNKANEPFSDSVDWFQDNSWQTNSDNAKDRTNKEEDDSFDEWNDFASSTVNQDSSKGSWNQSGNEISGSSQPKPEMDLFMSTDNLQEVHFSGFYQSDPFSGSSSNAVGFGDMNYIQPEVSTTYRTTDAMVGENYEQPEKKNEDVSTGPLWKDDVEMLMSQMHDLSFMLETSLSVPSKPDGAGSFLHD